MTTFGGGCIANLGSPDDSRDQLAVSIVVCSDAASGDVVYNILGRLEVDRRYPGVVAAVFGELTGDVADNSAKSAEYSLCATG